MTNATAQRSNFLGVYNNTQESSKGEVPFRAAVRRGHGPSATWVNCGYTKSENVAAKVYNIYALNFFGKGAILNDVELSQDELQEFNVFLNAKEKRMERFCKARDTANTARANNHVFRKHTELTPVETASVETVVLGGPVDIQMDALAI